MPPREHPLGVLVESAHAKLNLTLAVTGRRADGFHDLVSLVVTLALADQLALHPGTPLGLTCDDPTLPVDETNLVLAATAAYLRHQPTANVGRFHLAKKIPSGAGLGGGSADAAAALRLLDRAAAQPLGFARLEAIAAEVGSDCPYFIRSRSAVMRGRGERLEPLAATSAAALLGRRVIVIKPPFGVPTPEAYGRLAQRGVYTPASVAEQALASWAAQPAQDPALLGNDLEDPVFSKYLALPVALAAVSQVCGVRFRLTGSGSACFAIVPNAFALEPVRSVLTQAWGVGAWVADTQISA